ncbi:hypothetical protein GQ53DRAFT_225837 [Thozetella sp. PMI_491]|nr:hypothetical protein GQ53DRAFT_225837 [Thozetella sp. PMI_491]
MLLSHALSLVLLPLAAARPYPESAAPAARGALGERMLLSSAAAEAQFNFQPWEFRNICLECNRNQTTEQYACKTKFDWYDPNSVPENNVTSGSCLSDAWTWDGAAVSAGGKVSYPSENKACFYQSTLNYLSFNLAKFESEKNFTLSVVHRYKDDQ